MNNLQIFNFEETKALRTINKDGNPWFVAKDLCDVLELENTSRALSRLDDNEKAEVTLSNASSNGVIQQRIMAIVNESGMYSLVLTSRKPSALKFKRWVTGEVIPSIRKTGSYGVENISPTELILKMAQSLVDKEHSINNLDSRVSVLEQMASVTTPHIELSQQKSTTKAKKEIRYISVKEGGLELGVTLKDGVSQGIGRSLSSICRKESIPVKRKLLNGNGISTIATYPDYHVKAQILARNLV